ATNPHSLMNSVTFQNTELCATEHSRLLTSTLHVSRLEPESMCLVPRNVKQKTVDDFLSNGNQFAPPVDMAKPNVPEINHSVSIDVELPVAYLALTEPHHVHKWWSADSYMEPFVGGKLKLGALQHDCTLVVDRLEIGRLVEWRCIEARSGAAKL